MSDVPAAASPYADLPRWEIDCQALSKALGIVEAFPAGSALFFSLEQVEEGGKQFLALYATNRDYVFEANFPILNEDPYMFDRKIYVKFPLLHSLVKAYPEFIFKFDKGEVFFHNQVANHVLKPIMFDGQYFPAPDYSQADFQPLPVSKTVLSSVRKLFEFASRLVDNKVQWKEDHLFGSFITYAFDIKLAEAARSSMQFRKHDMVLLTALASVSPNLKYATVGDRFVVLGAGCALSFLKLASAQEFRLPLRKDKYGEVTFELDYLQKVLSFIKNDPTSQTIIFNPREGNIYVRVAVVNTFYVGHGKVPGYGFALRIDELRHILSVLPEGTKEVACSIYGDGAEFVVDSDGVRYDFILAKIDTTQTISTNAEVLDRLSVQREAARAEKEGKK